MNTAENDRPRASSARPRKPRRARWRTRVVPVVTRVAKAVRRYLETGRIPRWTAKGKSRLVAIPQVLRENSAVQRVASWPLWALGSRLRFLWSFKAVDQLTGVGFARELLADGAASRCGFAALLFGCIAAAVAVGSPSASAGPSRLALTAGLGVLSVAWAFAIGAVARGPLPLYVVVAAYTVWYGSLAGGALAGTPLFALPTVWLAWVGVRVARSRPSRWRGTCLLLMGLGIGQLSAGALGWNHIWGAHAAWGRFAMGLLCAGVLHLAVRWPRRPTARGAADGPQPGGVIVGTLLVTALFLGAALRRAPEQTGDFAVLVARGLLGFVDLAWMGLGATLVELGRDTGEWIAGLLARRLPARFSSRLLPTVWFAALAFAAWTTWLPPKALAFLVPQGRTAAWIDDWPVSLWYTVHWHLAASVVALVVWLRFRARRRGGERLAAQITGLWIAVWVALLGTFSSLEGYETIADDAAPPSGWWPLLVLMGGLLWEFAKGGAGYWESGGRARLHALVAALTAMLAIATLTLGAGQPDLVLEYTHYSFLGIVYLGGPLALAMVLPPLLHYEPVGPLRLAGLMGLGMLTAVLPLWVAPLAGWPLALAPPLWVGVLALVGRRLGRLAGRLDAVFAGGAIGLGCAIFWFSPEVIPVPFQTAWETVQQRYLSVPLGRPLLQLGQGVITAAAAVTGAGVGLAAVSSRRRWALPLAVAVGSVALALLGELVLRN